MNFKESRPIYLQIADRITDEILSGIYPEGERIPSVREYAAAVEVNANTVARSFDYLQGLRRRVFEEEELPELFRRMDLLGITLDDVRMIYAKRSVK